MSDKSPKERRAQLLEDILRLVATGQSQAAVANHLGTTRKTVRRYLNHAVSQGWSPQSETTDGLLRATLDAMKPKRRKRPTGEVLDQYKAQLQAWVRGDGEGRRLMATEIHRRLGEMGVQVPYSSLHRYLVRECAYTRANTWWAVTPKPSS